MILHSQTSIAKKSFLIMTENYLSNLLLDQSKDLIWMIDIDLKLIYANKSYLNLMKEMTGVEKKLNEPILIEGFGEGYIEKWTLYYNRAIKGEYFEIEEHYSHPETNEIQYGQITFKPLEGDNNKIVAVACQSRDITRIVKQRSEADQLINATLDVFCTINEQANFGYVNAAAMNHWGYLPEELIGKAYADLILEEDVPKTNDIAAAIRTGQEIKTFVNRYKKKNGEVAYNLWSARWDDHAKLMFAVARDGKEKIEQEKIIQHSEQRFKALVQEDLIYATAKNITEEKKLRELNRQASSLSKIGSWEVDLINQSLFWSEEVHQLHDTDPEKFIPDLEKAINFYREDFRHMVKLHLKNCITNREPFDFEAVLITSKKKERWIRAIGTGEFVDGVCKRVYGSFQDISSLKETENRLLSLAENLPGIVFQYVINIDGTDSIRYLSGSVSQIWGFATSDIEDNLKIVWDRVNAAGDFEKVQASIIKAVQTKSNWRCRFKYVLPSGELRTHLGNGTPIFLADGTIVFNSIILDITQEVKNEVLLKQASTMARIGSWEMDLINQDKDDMYWSPVVKEIFEVDQSYKPKLRRSLKFYIGDSKDRKQQAMRLLIKNGVEFDDEYLLLTDKGKERWIRCIGKSEMANNIRTKIFGSFQDISDQKLAEERIRKALEERNRILESIGDAFFAIDNDGIVTYWNKQAELILGKKKEELLGKPLWDVYHYLTDTDLFSQFLHIRKTKQTTDFEVYSPRLNIWLEISGYPSEEGISVYLKDITLRKEAAMQLQQANERFEKVTEATNDVIWDWDIINQTNYRSKAIERFFGKNALTLSSSNEFWKDSFYPEDLPKIKDSIYEAIANPSGTRWELEYRIYNEQGKILYIIDRGIIIRNNEGKAIRMVGTMTDITEQKELQIQEEKLMEDIVQRNKNLEQFSYIISHNLRSPVANILGLISLLQEENIPAETLDYINNSINLSANKLDEVIKDLNDILQVKNNVTEIKELVNFKNLASDIYVSIENLIKKENATITSNFSEVEEMMTIKSYLHSIFYNLVSNSLKYRQRHVPLLIEITSQLINNKIVLLFKDNGLGIDLEKQNNMVFGLYKRFHANYAEGKGVGLFMVKTQVETIGGSINIISEVNKGTVFRIEFPV